MWREVVRAKEGYEKVGPDGEAQNGSQWRKKIKGQANLGLGPGAVPGCSRVLRSGVPLKR